MATTRPPIPTKPAPPRVAVSLLFMLLAAGVFFALAPIASAEVIPSLNGSTAAVTSIQTNTASLVVNPLNGKLLVIYTDEVVGSDDNCRMALSSDGGVTWPRDKVLGMTTNQQCIATWIDADSFLVMNSGGIVKRTDNDGITFTTLTALPSGGVPQDIYAYNDQIYAISQMIVATSVTHFYSTTNGGTTWTDATYQLGASGVFTGLRYSGTAGQWSMGIQQGTSTWFARTTDTWTTTPTIGNGGLTVAWHTTDAGTGKCFANDATHEAWYGLFTAANSAFSTSLDLGVNYWRDDIGGAGGYFLDNVYGNAGASRTITFAQIATPPLGGCNLIHGDHYFAAKQTGDTITPRFLVGTGNGGGLGSPVRQIEDLDASATATLNGIDGYEDTLYILYRDGSGGSLRARLITAPDFGFSGEASFDYAAPATENIIGFDVDISGANIIYRYTDTGTPTTTFVSTLPAQTLSGKLATANTGCQSIYGVTAAQENVAFSKCTGSGVSSIEVLDPGLSDTFVPAACTDVEGADIDSWAVDLAGISAFSTYEFGSIDYEFVAGEFDGGCTIIAVIGFTDLDGKIGFLGLIHFVGGSTSVQHHRAQYTTDAQNGAEDIAVCEPDASSEIPDAQQTEYLIAIHHDQPTRAYVNNDDTNSAQLVSTGSGALGSAVSISCSGSNTARALLITGSHVYGYNYKTGSVAWQHSNSNVVPLSGAESWDGKWGAYADSEFIRIINMTDGSVLENISLPTGYIREIHMDSTGQSIFVWTDSDIDHILKYDIHAITTGTPIAPGDRTPNDPTDCVIDCDDDDSTGTAGQLFSPSPQSCSTFGSCSNASGFMATMYIAFCAAGIGGLPIAEAEVSKKTRNPHKVNWKVVGGFAIAGGLIGSISGYYVGIVPIGVLVVVVLFIVGAIVAMLWSIFGGK